VQRAQGNLPAALESFRAALAIRDRLAKADPGNAGWQLIPESSAHDFPLGQPCSNFHAPRGQS